MCTMSTAFRYSLDNGRLTTSQRIFYEENGYLMFPKLIPQNVLDKCHKRFTDIVEGTAPRSGITVMRDVKDRKSVNKLQDLVQDDVFQEYLKHQKILDIVEAFTGSNIMAIHSMLIAKPPDVGFGTSKHPPHQDLYYFPIRPSSKIVAAWTAMEPCTPENGCLYVAPGSHRLDKLFAHDYEPGSSAATVNKFYHGILDIPKNLTWVNLKMNPGDTVFFNPLLIHGSGVNLSKRTRCSISCHYASADCHYIDVNNTVQKTISDEIMKHVRDRVGDDTDLDYTDVWKYRSMLVRGIRSNL